MNAPDEMYKTHWPNTSIGKLRAISAKPANPKKAIIIFPVSERKFASLVIF
jgi:hypothetical protein